MTRKGEEGFWTSQNNKERRRRILDKPE